MTQQNISSVILRFTLDEASQRRVIKGIGDVEQVLSQTKRQTVSVENAAAGLNAEFAELARAKAIDNLTAEAISAATATDDWGKSLRYVSEQLSAIGASDDEIKQVARSLANAGQGGGSARGGGNNSGLERVDRLGSVGSQLLSGLGQGELANVAGIVGDVAGGVSSLGVAGIAAAGALAAVSVAMSEYNRQLEAQKTALKGALDAQNRYYEAVQSFTSDQARSEIESEQARIEALTQQRAETQGALDSAFAQAQQAFGDGFARVLDTAGQLPTAQLREQLKNLDAQLTSSEGYVARLTQGLQDLTFATRDNADAVARAVEQYTRDEEKRAQVEVRRAQYLVRANQMTEEERQARLAEINTEIAVLDMSRRSTELSWQAASQLNAQISDLEDEANALNSVFGSTADAMAEVQTKQEALTEQTDAYFKALENETKAREALAEAQRKAQEDYEEYIKKSREISQEADDRANEIAADGAERRADIERKAQDTIAKIMRDYGRTNAQSIAERDALAAYQAKIQRDDSLEDEGKARSDALKEQEKAQAKALDSLKASIQKQARALEDSYAHQQQITAQAAARAQVDLTNLEYTKNAIAMGGANSQRVIHGDMWNSLFTIATNYATAIANTVQFILGGTGGGTAGAGSIGARGGAQPIAYAVNQAVDYRLNQYFQAAGITER